MTSSAQKAATRSSKMMPKPAALQRIEAGVESRCLKSESAHATGPGLAASK